MFKTKGFTLIELLIVVAIIAILAAIAVPNFLEAQIRSKVSRVKSDMRSLATSLQSYNVDYNHFPPNDAAGPIGESQFRLDRFGFLTTPIAYITSYPGDPFIAGETASAGQAVRTFQYFNYDYRWSPDKMPGIQNQYVSWGWLVRSNPDTFDIKGVCLKSFGPNSGKESLNPAAPGDDAAEWAAFGLNSTAAGIPGVDLIYDPTNGTISKGDIVRFVGSVPAPESP